MNRDRHLCATVTATHRVIFERGDHPIVTRAVRRSAAALDVSLHNGRPAVEPPWVLRGRRNPTFRA